MNELMPLNLEAWDVALRLAATVLASAALGLNRGLRGHAVGLRTTILVGLAASIAMMEANTLLPLAGKPPGSFIQLDLMRLPLGILTGVGFIGGGAILKRGDLIAGVTTAATIWTMTVIGLCIGGGQIGLGLAGTGVALLTVWALQFVDTRIPREQRATLVIETDIDAATLSQTAGLPLPPGYRSRLLEHTQVNDDAPRRFAFEVRWRRPEIAGPPTDLVLFVTERYKIRRLELPPDLNE